jgi:predicted phage-related endonuclease
LFYDKVLGRPEFKSNVASYMGNFLEDKVAKLWEHAPGPGFDVYNQQEAADFIERLENGTKVRHARKPTCVYQSKKYPWMFASPDRLFVHHEEGDRFRQINCPLEIKTISGYVTKKWEHGVPPMYLLQLMHYMVVLGSRYGELALLEDGRYIVIHKFSYAKDIGEQIIARTKVFWDLVTEAREQSKELVTYYWECVSNGNSDEARMVRSHIDDILAEFCPPPDGSEAYEEFLSTRWNADSSKIVAPTKDVKDALMRLSELNKQIDRLEEEARLFKNTIKNYMGNATVLTLGEAGKVTWRENKNGQRSFRIDGVKQHLLEQVQPIEL